MVDANARINVDINIADALAELKILEKQIQLFNKSIVQGSAQAKKVQDDFNSSLLHNINATGKFVASMSRVNTEAERFTNALEKNKLSAREYFRYSMASTRTFGRLFSKEFGTITKVAEERVKQLQARHIELGRAADGAMRSVKIVPTSLDYSKPITQMQMAIMKQQIFNKLLDAGTTKLLNFGKNTQWAGRQLMVGFTIPLTILGSTAIKTFRDMEKQAIRFKKVYGDMFTVTADTNQALDNVKNLAKEFTKYGVAVEDTMKMAADAAAAGNTGKQLESVITQATKLSVLGGVAQDQALEATVAIQNAFRVTGDELNNTINFLNAVENQTVVALDDITEAIPKVAPVIKQLGGDIKDLAFFMAAMQEGGVNASEAANALKSGLASMINPTREASKMAAELGINLKGIVDVNAGDVRGMVLSLAEAIRPLDELSKARLIEQIFGKFQFARISTLLDNVARSGNQASRVLSLTTATTEELGIMAERELGITAESSATKFAAAMEKLKASLAPVGEEFVKALLPLIEFGTKILEKFNNLSDGTKQIITRIVAIVGGIGPVLLMGIGLVANGIANLVKGISLLRKGYQFLTGSGRELGLSTQYLTSEQLESLSAAQSLHSAHQNLTSQFALETSAVLKLTTAYREAAAAAQSFAVTNPGMVKPGTASKLNRPKFGPKKFAKGGWVPGSGNKDTVPAVLMPGEFVVKKDAAQRNSQALETMNKGGQVHRSQGTPRSNNGMEFRSGGSQSGKIAFAHIQENVGVVQGNDLYKLLDLGSMDKMFDPLKIAKEFGLDLSGIKSTAIVAGDLGLPLDRTINGLLDKADLEGGQGVSGKQLKESLVQSIDDSSKTTADKKRRLARSMGINTRSKEGKSLADQMFDNIKKQIETTIQDDATYSDKGKNGHRSFYTEGQQIVQKAASAVPGLGGYVGVKKKIAQARQAISEVRMQFQDPLLRELKQRGIIEGPDEKGKFKVLQGAFKGQTISARIGSQNRAFSSELGRVLDGVVQEKTANGQTTRVEQKMLQDNFRKPPTVAPGMKRLPFGGWVRRAGGTPSYGEQGVTPAMLTPGEFVMNAKSAQANGPALQAMNMGGEVKFRQDPTGPGYDPKLPSAQDQKWSKTFQDNLLWSAKDPNNPTAEERSVAAEETNRQLGIKNKGNKLRQRVSKVGSAISSRASSMSMPKIKTTSQATGTTTSSPRPNQGYRPFQGAGAQNMAFAGFAVSGMMTAMSQGEGPAAKMAKSMEQYSYMLSLGMMALPMLSSKIGVLTVVLGSMAAAYMYMKVQIEKGAEEGKKLAQQMTVTSDNLKEMERITGKAGLSSIERERRTKGLQTINPIKSDFGDTFIGTDLGKAMISAAEKGGPDFAKNIGNQLSIYIAEGLISANDAESVAQTVADQLGDQSVALKINAQLMEIIGPNGINLLSDPISVRMKILESTTAENKKTIDQLTKQTEAAYKGFRVSNNPIGGQKMNAAGTVGAGMAAGAGTGAGIGAGIGTLFGPAGTAIGAGVGAVLGTVVGGIVAYKALVEQQAKAARMASKLASFQVTANAEFMRQAVAMQDGLKAETKQRLDNIDRLKSELTKKLEITKDAKERLAIEQKLRELDTRRGATVEQGQQGQQDIQRQIMQSYNSIETMYNNAVSDTVRGNIEESSESALKKKYEDSPLLTTVEAVLGMVNEFDNKVLSLQIEAALTSDQISPGNMLQLLNMFDGDEKAISQELQLWVNNKSLTELNRLQNALVSITDPKQYQRVLKEVRSMNAEEGEFATKFLETTQQLAGAKVNGKIVFDAEVELPDISNTDMIEAGKDLEKIDGLIKGINEQSDEASKKKFVADFITEDADFAGLQYKIDYFLGLNDENKKIFTTVFRTLVQGITQDDIDERVEEMSKSPMTQGWDNAKRQKAALQSLLIDAGNTAKLFTEVEGSLPEIPGVDPEEEKGTQKSLAITTAQLVELRLKGLNPVAAAQLDGSEAAKVLSGSAEEQKNKINSLNAALRQNAIQSQLLKTDQQVLADQISATSDAIGAYVSMIENTEMKAIQEKIDSYKDLDETQQQQMQDYNKGLSDISKKEEEITNRYNERTKALDLVSRANERNARQLKGQIDLATALTTGDIAAAASAMAEMTQEEAQYQVENTRLALDRAMQEEIKSLTIEINGQYLTREQIEININNIEEEIYQRSLLIRAEQEKLRDVEKQISAEKEKQRKLQVLTQMSQISERIQTTADAGTRQSMLSQLGYLGQSIGVSDITSQEQFNTLGQQLGVNINGIAATFASASATAQLTTKEMAKITEDVLAKVGDVSKYIQKSSEQAYNAYTFMQSLKNNWEGQKGKNNGLVDYGNTISTSLKDTGDLLVGSYKAVKATIDKGMADITDLINSFNPNKKKVAFGGYIGKYAMGGNVNYKGSREPAPVRMSLGSLVPGMGNVDRVPALLTPGEFVVRKSVARENMGLLKALNGDIFPQIKEGFGLNSIPEVELKSNVENSSNMYNSYSINVNVSGTNASPDEIANVVVSKIRRSTDRQIRGNRL